jgi:ligand-binding sensor domain-containing protein/two-component sensor histidine kinase
MKVIVVILFIALSIHGYCQQYSYRQFTTADGLPSNVVYGAYQDSKGFIWFFTNAGVSRFNGISFQNFTVEQGLSDNEVFGAFEVAPGRIWFRTFSNKLCYYENDRFHNSKTDPWLDKRFGAMKAVYVDKNNLAWTRYSFDDSVYIMDESRKSIKRVSHFYKDSSIIVTNQGVDTISLAEEKLVLNETYAFAKKHGSRMEKMTDVVEYFMLMRRYVHAVADQHPNVPLHYIYFVFINMHPVSKFRLHELVINANGSYWLPHGNKGILHGNNLYDLEERPFVYLPEQNVNNYLIDAEGNRWFTSPTAGVFFLKGHAVKTYNSREDAEIYAVNGNDEYIICGKERKVTFINKRSSQTIDWEYDVVTGSAYNRIRDLLMDKKGNCWVASDFGVASIRLAGNKVERVYPRQPLSKPYYIGAMKCLSPGSGDSILLGSHAQLLGIDNKNHISPHAYIRTNAVVQVPGQGMVIGSIDGLHTLRNNVLSRYHADTIKEHITDLDILKRGFLCAATNDLGLIILKGNEFFRITTKDSIPLASNICRKIFVDPADNIWVCTNNGLCKVTITSVQPFLYVVRQFTTDDGLTSNDVNDVYVSGDTVWVATSHGLSFFNQNEVKRLGTIPKIYISRADTLMDKSFPFGAKVAIGLEGVSFESLGKLRYRYRIRGLYDDWQETERNLLLYDVLPPGRYELEVYSINRFGQQSAEPAKVIFSIVPPWWRSIWALVYYVLTFIAILAIAFILIRRNTRIKERNRMRLEQLELKALRSQMNPHFIFNMLNAVQKYILDNDKEASYRYLTRFSKLIRSFLENSRQTTISLSDELDLLRSYMEMEALRFRNKFTYDIEIDPALDTAAVYIPSMLIQPYVENAIWHGIQHKATNGFVKLSVKNHGNNMLLCRIQDNGIGRRRAGEIASASGNRHQPVGMTITQQRLELINQRLKQAVSVNFIDVEEEMPGTGTGTIVELIIAYSTRKI